jgi:hypothetical protein
MAKPKEKAKPKLEINRVLAAIDAKDRNFYDTLTDEELKGFSPFLAIRYASSVDHSMPEVCEYVLEAANRRANPHFFDFKDHPKLQWLLLTTTSMGLGPMRHSWIKPLGGKKSSNDRLRNFLAEQFPSANSAELDILLATNSQEDILEYAASLGYQEKEISKLG